MANELTKRQNDAVAVIEGNDLADIMKPLIREIHLFDSFVAGTSYLKDPSVLNEIKAGDSLIMRREDNKFDSNAILIFSESGKKVGYVPEKDNVVFARLMDAGKILKGKVGRIERKGSFTKIAVGIYLVDY